jgi:hypothetical protein
MPPTTPPKDALGNELHEGDIVTMQSDRPIFFRVMKIDNGGIQTPQGVTPGVVIIGVTLTIRTIPGAQLPNIAKVVSPGNDELVKKLLETPS